MQDHYINSKYVGDLRNWSKCTQWQKLMWPNLYIWYRILEYQWLQNIRTNLYTQKSVKHIPTRRQTAPGDSNIMSFSYAFVYATRPIYSAQSCRQWFFHNCEIKNLSSNFRKEKAHKKIGNEGVREGERDLFSLLKLQLKHLQPHQQPPGEQLVPWLVHQEGPISHFLPEVALLQELPVDLGGWSRQVKGNFSIW